MLISNHFTFETFNSNKKNIKNDEDATDTEKYCQICLLRFDNKRHKMEPNDDLLSHKCINKCCIDCIRKIYISTHTYKCPFCRKEFREWIIKMVPELISDLQKKIKKNNLIKNNNIINILNNN